MKPGPATSDHNLSRAQHALLNELRATRKGEIPAAGGDDNRWLAEIAAGMTDRQLLMIRALGPQLLVHLREWQRALGYTDHARGAE